MFDLHKLGNILLFIPVYIINKQGVISSARRRNIAGTAGTRLFCLYAKTAESVSRVYRAENQIKKGDAFVRSIFPVFQQNYICQG